MISTTTRYQKPEIECIALPQNGGRWNLVVDFLKLRQQVFITQKKWQLREDRGIEFEQYDTATVATYIIAHLDGEILGGARLIRCDTKIGSASHGYTYMINDAYIGRIDLPAEICEEQPPKDWQSWELTRLVSVDKDRRTARTILDGANDFIKREGGNKCLFLGPPGFLRMAKAYGYDPVRLGQICENESGKFLAFSCDVI